MDSNRSFDDFYRSILNGTYRAPVADSAGANSAEAVNAMVSKPVADNIPELVLNGSDFKLYGPTGPSNAPAVLTWKNLNVITKITRHVKTQKVLLNNLSGTVSGGLYAIMGASGSGKTTLQCVLAQRLDTHNMTITGDVLLNGHPYSKAELKSMSGFVMQDDLLAASLTVEETLWYTAVLRLPRSVGEEERMERIDEVLKMMGISYTRQTIIGDTRRKGVSGGERKRVCVAMELLMRPKMLFLDEPTSGLDSTTSLSLITTLKTMTDRGACTVLATIHQPQTKIFQLFDNLILMKKGNIVYQGNTENAEAYFAAAGYPAPPRCNPADHFLDVLSIGANDTSVEPARVPKMVIPLDMDYGSDKEVFSTRDTQPWHMQFYYLFLRNMKEKSRQMDVFVMNLVVSIMVGFFLGYSPTWFEMGNGYKSVSKRQPLLFFCVIHQGVVAYIQGTFSFPMERALMLRERAAGSYYVSAYFCSKFIVEQIYQIPPPILFSILVYPLTKLQPVWSKFFIFVFFQIMCTMAATSLANMFACICGTIDMAAIILALALEITRLYSSFFISPLILNSNVRYEGWKFADALSYMKYVYVGLCVNEYEGLKLTCNQNDPVAAFTDTTKTVCRFQTGDQMLRLVGMEDYTLDYCFGILALYIVGVRFISYLGLRYLKA